MAGSATGTCASAADTRDKFGGLHCLRREIKWPQSAFTFIAVAGPTLVLLRRPKTRRGCSAHYARRAGSSGCRSLATSSRTAAAVSLSMQPSLGSKPRGTSSSRARPSCWVSSFPPRVAKGHPMSEDAPVVYIFHAATDDPFAVTRGMTGANLPRASCAQGWILRDKFLVGEYASIPAPIDYYILPYAPGGRLARLVLDATDAAQQFANRLRHVKRKGEPLGNAALAASGLPVAVDLVALVEGADPPHSRARSP